MTKNNYLLNILKIKTSRKTSKNRGRKIEKSWKNRGIYFYNI
jgi:hypothetical protein